MSQTCTHINRRQDFGGSPAKAAVFRGYPPNTALFGGCFPFPGKRKFGLGAFSKNCSQAAESLKAASFLGLAGKPKTSQTMALYIGKIETTTSANGKKRMKNQKCHFSSFHESGSFAWCGAEISGTLFRVRGFFIRGPGVSLRSTPG